MKFAEDHCCHKAKRFHLKTKIGEAELDLGFHLRLETEPKALTKGTRSFLGLLSAKAFRYCARGWRKDGTVLMERSDSGLLWWAGDGSALRCRGDL